MISGQILLISDKMLRLYLGLLLYNRLRLLCAINLLSLEGADEIWQNICSTFMICYVTWTKNHPKMVFCYQNWSDLLWEKLFQWSRKTFEIRGWRPRICKIFVITWTIYSNSERSEQFLVTECFFNLFLKISQI